MWAVIAYVLAYMSDNYPTQGYFQHQYKLRLLLYIRLYFCITWIILVHFIIYICEHWRQKLSIYHVVCLRYFTSLWSSLMMNPVTSYVRNWTYVKHMMYICKLSHLTTNTNLSNQRHIYPTAYQITKHELSPYITSSYTRIVWHYKQKLSLAALTANTVTLLTPVAKIAIIRPPCYLQNRPNPFGS